LIEIKYNPIRVEESAGTQSNAATQVQPAQAACPDRGRILA
jgi:hypothetical protein